MKRYRAHYDVIVMLCFLYYYVTMSDDTSRSLSMCMWKCFVSGSTMMKGFVNTIKKVILSLLWLVNTRRKFLGDLQSRDRLV